MSITYTARVKALALVAQRTEEQSIIDETKNLRKSSDAMEIIGHPKNPKFFPERLKEDDPSRKKLKDFKRDFDGAMNKTFDAFEARYGKDHSRALGDMVMTGEYGALESYLEEHFPKGASPK